MYVRWVLVNVHGLVVVIFMTLRPGSKHRILTKKYKYIAQAPKERHTFFCSINLEKCDTLGKQAYIHSYICIQIPAK